MSTENLHGVPAIVVFVDTVTQDVPIGEFDIASLEIEEDSNIGLLGAIAQVDGETLGVDIPMPLSYLSLLTAFAYSPEPMLVYVFDVMDREEVKEFDGPIDPAEYAYAVLQMPNPESEDFLFFLDEITDHISPARSAPMQFNIKQVYSPYFVNARAALYRDLTDIAHGRSLGLENVALIASEDRLRQLREQGDSSSLPDTLYGNDLEAHDAFVRGYMLFLETAYTASASLTSEPWEINEANGYDGDDIKFMRLISESGLPARMDKIDMEDSGIDLRSFSSHLVYPLTPEWPESMQRVKKTLMGWENYTQVMSTIEKPKLQEGLALDTPSTVQDSAIVMALMTSARAARVQERSAHYPESVITVASAISDFIGTQDGQFSLWELDALTFQIVDYDLETFQELLASTVNSGSDVDDYMWLHLYGAGLLIFFLSMGALPDQKSLQSIFSESDVYRERSENFTLMVLEYVNKFFMMLGQQAQQDKGGSKIVHISIPQQDIINYSITYFDSVLSEFEEQPDMLVGLDADSDTLEKDFFAEAAYQFSYVLPMLSDLSAQTKKLDFGSEEWKQGRMEFISSVFENMPEYTKNAT